MSELYLDATISAIKNIKKKWEGKKVGGKNCIYVKAVYYLLQEIKEIEKEMVKNEYRERIDKIGTAEHSRCG